MYFASPLPTMPPLPSSVVPCMALFSTINFIVAIISTFKYDLFVRWLQL